MPTYRTVPASLLGRAFSASEALEAGMSRAQLRGKRITKLSRDLFVIADEPVTLVDRCRWFLTVLPDDTLVSHWTAAELLEVPTRRCLPIHVTVEARFTIPRRRELVVHGQERYDEDAACTPLGIPITSGPRLYVDLAPALSRRELIAAGDAILRHRLATPESLAWRVAMSAGQRGVVNARNCLPLLDGRAQSRPESLLRTWVIDSGLPAPTPQAPVRNAYGVVVAHADLGYEELKIAIEYEGRHHADSDQFGRDIERYSRMAANGWLVLRFSKEHLRHPAVIVARVRAAIESR